MVISDCEFVIFRVTDNYMLHSTIGNEKVFQASSLHVQSLMNLLLESQKKPFTLEVRA